MSFLSKFKDKTKKIINNIKVMQHFNSEILLLKRQLLGRFTLKKLKVAANIQGIKLKVVKDNVLTGETTKINYSTKEEISELLSRKLKIQNIIDLSNKLKVDFKDIRESKIKLEIQRDDDKK